MVFVSAVACAGSHLSAGDATREQIAQAVRELGDDSFRVRARASEFLWQWGRSAEPDLREALKSTDREVVRRASAILDKLSWGLYPDTPPEIATLIGAYRAGDTNAKSRAIEQLLALGKRGRRAAVKIASAEDDAEIRKTVFSQSGRLAEDACLECVAEDDFEGLEELLKVDVVGGNDQAFRNYATFLVLRGKLDETIAVYLARAGKTDGASAAEILAYLCLTKGDLAGISMPPEKRAAWSW